MISLADFIEICIYVFLAAAYLSVVFVVGLGLMISLSRVFRSMKKLLASMIDR